MKKNKCIVVLLVMVMSFSMVMTGCGFSDAVDSMSEKLSDLFGGRNNSRHSNDDDDDDDDKHNGKKPGSGNSNSHGNAQAVDVDLETQYQLLAGMNRSWFLGSHYDQSRYEVTYGITDLDGNGRLEVIQKVEGAYANDSSLIILEVNESGDGLNEVQVVFDGHAYPDVSKISSAYETSEGYYYSTYDYAFDTDYYYLDYYVLKMENGVINAQMIKYAKVEIESYDYSYFDAQGNPIADSEFYGFDMEDSIGEYSYVSRYVTMEDEARIAFPKQTADNTDLYYFVEHNYTIFEDRGLSYGDYDGTLTIYTDPSLADYQALEDVVVLNEGAGGVPVRFTFDSDSGFGLLDGVWSDELGCFISEGYCEELYYNRAYEINLNIPDNGEIGQVISYGNVMLGVTEANFGKKNGTYTVKIGEYIEGGLTTDSTYVKALGIVAYEVYKAGGKTAFTGDEELFYKTFAEVATYLMDVNDSIIIRYDYYDKIMKAFFDWDWEAFYYDGDLGKNYVEYHDFDDGCIIFNDDYHDEEDNYSAHYRVYEMDYLEALNAVENVEMEYYHDSPSTLIYSFGSSNGSATEINFSINGTCHAAFGVAAVFLGIY